MTSTKKIAIFLFGAQVFHTISHIWMAFFMKFPVHTKFFTISARMNFWGIVINIIIAALLFVWVKKLNHRKAS